MTAFRALVVMLAVLSVAPVQAQTRIPIALELVLAVDTSASVNGAEHALQLRGIARALRAPRTIELIEAQDGVAITLIQWAGWVGARDRVPWRLLTDRRSVLRLADEIEALSRDANGHSTAIGSALAEAIRLIQTNRYQGRRTKIDLSGDGQNNAGLPLERVRRQARSLGITINGLAILTDRRDLDQYFRRHVITGPDAFVIAAQDHRTFADAMRRKLQRELQPPGIAGAGGDGVAIAGEKVFAPAARPDQTVPSPNRRETTR